MSAIFSATNLSVQISNKPIVTNTSFDLRNGEFVGLIGPNGAGKTTLLRAMAGAETAQGDMKLGDTKFAELSAQERAKKIAYLPQGHVFHWPMPVASVVALGRLPHADFFSQISKDDEAAVAKAISRTGISDLAQRAVTTLSGGEQARVALARLLATQAAIILADEPTGSLDLKHQLIVMNLLRQAARDGAAVLAVIHDLTLVARFCDRVLVMDKGHIVADAPPEQALAPEKLSAIFGVDAVMVDTGEGRVPFARKPL